MPNRWLLHLPNRWLLHWPNRWLLHWLNRWLLHWLNRWLLHWLNRWLRKSLRILTVSAVVVIGILIIVLGSAHRRLNILRGLRILLWLSILLRLRRLIKCSVLICSSLFDRIKSLTSCAVNRLLGLLYQRFFRFKAKRLSRLLGFFGKRALWLITGIVFIIIVHNITLK